VEFAISASIMFVLVFGLVDFSRAIYFEELMTNLTGEGSSMASRGTSLPDTATALVAAGGALKLATDGQVIISSVFNNNGKIQLQRPSLAGRHRRHQSHRQCDWRERDGSGCRGPAAQSDDLRDRSLLPVSDHHADR